MQTIKSVTRAAGAPKGGTTETILTAAGGAAASSLARATRGAKGAALAEAAIAKLGPKGVAVIGASGIGLVGLLSYYITKSIIDKRAAARLERSELANKLARAYREARESARILAGGTLDKIQHAILAEAFQEQLAELGLSTTNLKGL